MNMKKLTVFYGLLAALSGATFPFYRNLVTNFLSVYSDDITNIENNIGSAYIGLLLVAVILVFQFKKARSYSGLAFVFIVFTVVSFFFHDKEIRASDKVFLYTMVYFNIDGMNSLRTDKIDVLHTKINLSSSKSFIKFNDSSIIENKNSMWNAVDNIKVYLPGEPGCNYSMDNVFRNYFILTIIC